MVCNWKRNPFKESNNELQSWCPLIVVSKSRNRMMFYAGAVCDEVNLVVAVCFFLQLRYRHRRHRKRRDRAASTSEQTQHIISHQLGRRSRRLRWTADFTFRRRRRPLELDMTLPHDVAVPVSSTGIRRCRQHHRPAATARCRHHLRPTKTQHSRTFRLMMLLFDDPFRRRHLSNHSHRRCRPLPGGYLIRCRLCRRSTEAFRRRPAASAPFSFDYRVPLCRERSLRPPGTHRRLQLRGSHRRRRRRRRSSTARRHRASLPYALRRHRSHHRSTGRHQLRRDQTGHMHHRQYQRRLNRLQLCHHRLECSVPLGHLQNFHLHADHGRPAPLLDLDYLADLHLRCLHQEWRPNFADFRDSQQRKRFVHSLVCSAGYSHGSGTLYEQREGGNT